MKRSTDRILTTHVGSLPRPADLMALYRDQAPAGELETTVTKAAAEVVGRQGEAGVDVVNGGEYGKPMSEEADYGVWAFYLYQRLSGFEFREQPAGRSNIRRIMQGSKDRGLRGLL